MTTPRVARTREALLDHRFDLADQHGGETAVVMTLGALHDGHVALIRRARDLVDDTGVVLVTIFVNPLQFGAGEDLERYPRTFDDDLAVCAREGVDLVFAPPEAEMYPEGQPQITVSPGPLGDQLEGASRPGHFAGVLTVVAKLLNLAVPSVAVFGEKDYQQLTLIRRMVRDLDLGVEIVTVPTVREPDGLALSSRNRFLDPAERKAAADLSRALRAGAAAGADGAAGVRAAALGILETQPGVDLGYLELRGEDLRPNPGPGEARLLVAARVGATRLIDNVPVLLGRRT